MKQQNLIGQKFNMLTVIRQAPSKGKNSYWHCRCECGKEIDVRRDCLTKGTIKSCGCYRSSLTSVDLTNKRFGKLIALEPTEKRVNHRIVWKCQCDCGKIIEVSSNALQQGQKLSCGCLKESLGEFKIAQLLEAEKIKFERQKIFKSCRFPDTNYFAYFDFYVDNKYLIEYDGEQHFISKNIFGGEEQFKKNCFNDNFKNQWCKRNNIPLIRIPYTHLKKISINDLLLEKSKFII